MARRDKMEVDNLDARPQFTFQNLTGADRTDSPILDLLNSVGHSTTTMPQQATIGSSHPPTPAQQVLNDLTPACYLPLLTNFFSTYEFILLFVYYL